MAQYSNLRGTMQGFFQIGGPNGPQWKNDSGALDARDSADSVFINVRGAAAVGTNDFVTLAQLLLNIPWTAVAAGAAVSVAAGAFYKIDVSGSTRATLTLPNAPTDGTSALFHCTGTPLSPPLIQAQGSDTVELYQQPGVFSGAAGATSLAPGNGAIFALKYQASTKQWAAFIIY